MTAGEFTLTHAELAELAAGEGRPVVRSRIVLVCSEPGEVYTRLAAEVGVSVMTMHDVCAAGSPSHDWPR